MTTDEKLNLIGKSNTERITKNFILKNETDSILVYSITFNVLAHTYDEDTSKDIKVRWEARGAICDVSVVDCNYSNSKNKLYEKKYSTYKTVIVGDDEVEEIVYDGSLLGWGGTDVKQYDSRTYSSSTKVIQLELQPGEENNIILDVIGHNATEGNEGDDTKSNGDQRFYVESTEISWVISGVLDV